MMQKMVPGDLWFEAGVAPLVRDVAIAICASFQGNDPHAPAWRGNRYIGLVDYTPPLWVDYIPAARAAIAVLAP